MKADCREKSRSYAVNLSLEKEFFNLKTDLLFVLSHFTPILQLLDQGIFSLFKQSIKKEMVINLMHSQELENEKIRRKKLFTQLSTNYSIQKNKQFKDIWRNVFFLFR